MTLKFLNHLTSQGKCKKMGQAATERRKKQAGEEEKGNRKNKFRRMGFTLGRGSGEGQEGPAPLQYLWVHPCYWPLLENVKSASSLAANLGHD